MTLNYGLLRNKTSFYHFHCRTYQTLHFPTSLGVNLDFPSIFVFRLFFAKLKEREIEKISPMSERILEYRVILSLEAVKTLRNKTNTLKVVQPTDGETEKAGHRISLHATKKHSEAN